MNKKKIINDILEYYDWLDPYDVTEEEKIEGINCLNEKINSTEGKKEVIKMLKEEYNRTEEKILVKFINEIQATL